MRIKKPDAERPYRAIGYPVLPALYIVGATAILVMLFTYRPATTWPGLVIVILGVPIYLLVARSKGRSQPPPEDASREEQS